MNKACVKVIMLASLAVPVSGQSQPGGPPSEDAHAKPPSTQKAQARAPVVLPLSQLPELAVGTYSMEALTRVFPAFHHAPFDKAGYCHFALPIRYEDPDSAGDPAEANAFTFLLSNALDWSPGSYCARHAFLTFKRCRKDMRRLIQSYQPSVIAALVEDWQATHAVGGTLIRSRNGFGGKLLIYNSQGLLVFQKGYPKPRDFFELLGDMTVDGLTFFGHRPSAALARHLHRRLCKHHQSIIDLGRAGFAEEKSRAEVERYSKILDRDPGFGDVRYWWANQRYWHDSNETNYRNQLALVLDSYPFISALPVYSAKEYSSGRHAGRHPRWVRQTEELVGPDFPDLLRIRLVSAMDEGRTDHALLQRALKVARRFPNQHWLLLALGNAYARGAGSPADPAMAAGILLTALRDRFLPGSGHKRLATSAFADSAFNLGRAEVHVQFALPEIHRRMKANDMASAGQLAALTAEMLFKMGRFEQAVRYYRIGFRNKKQDAPGRARALVEGAVAAALGGKTNVLQQILRDHHRIVEKAKMLPLLEAYRDVLSGKKVDLPALQATLLGMNHNTWWCWRQEVLFYTQMNLLAGNTDSRRSFLRVFRDDPSDRAFWYLADAYNRLEPLPDTPAFYEALEWLHGDDPWVRRAVWDYRRRPPNPRMEPPLTTEDLLERLEEYKPVRWPPNDGKPKEAAQRLCWELPPLVVPAAIRKSLMDREWKKARELALRFHHLAVAYANYALRAHANRLIHLVEQAIRKADQPAPNAPGTRLAKVPYVRQKGTKDCTPAVLEMLFRHHGLKPDRTEIDKSVIITTDEDKASHIHKVNSYLRRKKVPFVMFCPPDSAGVRRLVSQGHPVMVALELSEGRQRVVHSVLVVGFSAEQNTWHYHDPYYGRDRTRSADSFDKAWIKGGGYTRTALALYPPESKSAYGFSDIAEAFAEATYLLETKRLDEGIKTFEKLLARNNRFVPALLFLGSCYMRKGLNDKAERTFARAVALAPRHYWSIGLLKLGAVQFQVKKYEQAEKTLNRFFSKASRVLPAEREAARRIFRGIQYLRQSAEEQP